jgi:hypothetical protein
VKQDADIIQLNTRQIELHLKSAVDTLTPNILDRLDLSMPQDPVPKQQDQTTILRLQRRMRGMGVAVAACICLTLMGGGTFHYHLENRKIESVIGIDVNPSIELSINRKERVLEAKALNTEAENIIQDMDLKGVELNVAVNAVVGSMVTHGYLDDLENAILVTVSNDSVRKARELRASVVGDIEQTLKENQVEAVVYDQQVIEDEEMEALARQYDISYGKAYFLKELIDQNESLNIDDMEELASLSMEEIARKIAESSYELGELADQVKETELAPQTTAIVETETSTEVISTDESSTEIETTETSTTEVETTTIPETTKEPITEPETEEEELVEIDYVDFEDDMVYVYFMGRVKWKNPSVVVRDEEGNSYAAMIDEASRNECSFEVSGLEGGRGYIFVLGGLTAGDGNVSTTVKGYFEKPEVADGAENEFMDESGETETAEDEITAGEETGEIESVTESSTGESMTESITEEESDIQDTTEVREESGSEEERIEETSE